LTPPTVSKTTLQSDLLRSSFASLSARFENRYGCRVRSWLNRAWKDSPCQVMTENFRTQCFILWFSISVRSQARRNSLSFPRLVCYSKFRFRVRNWKQDRYLKVVLATWGGHNKTPLYPPMPLPY
jgi:hypothetical protein